MPIIIFSMFAILMIYQFHDCYIAMKKIKYIFSHICIIFYTSLSINIILPSVVMSKAVACFSPGLCCKENIRVLTYNAQSSIKIAVSHLADEEILEYLREALGRGVEVLFITDPKMFKSPDSIAYALSYSGAKVKMPSANFEGNKFAIFDDETLFIGSYDWVESSALVYSNNCVITENKDLLAEYIDRFNFLWSIYKR